MADSALPLAWLSPLPGGLPLPPMELTPTSGKGRGLIIGRNKDCVLRLPIGAEEVSRHHAEFVFQDARWHVADLGSRWGTMVNGMKLTPHRPVSIGEGDLIRIHPWTFRFSLRGALPADSVALDEDDHSTMVRLAPDRAGEPMRQDILTLLLEAAASIQAAADEQALAVALTDAARRGSGMTTATLLRALDANGNVTAIGADPGKSPAGQLRFSRSLLKAASRGSVAEFSGASKMDFSQSMMQSNVRAAICAPLMHGTTVSAYLYLDSVGGFGGASIHPHATAFCQALARMGGLALANLNRVAIERRAAQLEAELTAAAVAQQWILPRQPIASGPFICVGQTRPGGYLGGDFFDAQVLADGRLAVTLGDVSGHGAAASVLMTAAQGFLHASLAGHGDLASAMANLNAFVRPRCPNDKFITLWTGLFDPRQMTLHYIDAGHGYAVLLKDNGSFQKLEENGGLPIGVDLDFVYRPATVSLQPGERVLVISDGIIEQCSGDSSILPERGQFGLHGVMAAIQRSGGGDLIDQIFTALCEFAGGTHLSDDATGILVKWDGTADERR
jgi:phosphoserine phosphatase RsbU/P